MRFFTSGLVSKWGFSDGDLLDDLLYDLENAEGVTLDPHALLVAVVRQHVIPALNQRVEIEVIRTIHNPVRAIEVDGRDVRGMHYEPEAMSPLTPEVVEVEDESIRSLARQMADIRVPASGMDSTDSFRADQEGPMDSPRRTAVAEMDEIWPWEPTFCEWCDRELAVGLGEGYGELGPLLCKSCVGLDRCVDDMCHGAGYCMHSDGPLAGGTDG